MLVSYWQAEGILISNAGNIRLAAGSVRAGTLGDKCIDMLHFMNVSDTTPGTSLGILYVLVHIRRVAYII
jgi:hypothetical protein